MNDNFLRNERKKQELKGRPYADIIYNKIWNNIIIKRFDRDENYLLDKQFAIDVQIQLDNGMILIGQEKFLSYKYSSFNSVTIEYMQDWQSGECGDWFKLASQFYFISYFNKDETDFCKWAILNWPSIVLNTIDKNIIWNDNQNKDGKARASFRWYNINKIPEECIIKKEWPNV